ncbi:hypothetical protein AKJ09_05649 [Labilithrix luteola]|uniref:Uncharacterized protein n=1 Tax=Labilithrix luteola TaxID=1391654 RepID=A0A0K1PZM3_9BACT|nr:hypothetical protein AKJ09_05649 [Labilithrix luteola]
MGVVGFFVGVADPEPQTRLRQANHERTVISGRLRRGRCLRRLPRTTEGQERREQGKNKCASFHADKTSPSRSTREWRPPYRRSEAIGRRSGRACTDFARTYRDGRRSTERAM